MRKGRREDEGRKEGRKGRLEGQDLRKVKERI
jgi:hypothetical protein